MCELRACPDCAEVYGHFEKFIHAEATLSVFKGLVTVENSFRVFFEVPLCIRGERNFVQEADRHFRSCLHGLRQSPEDADGIVPDQIGSTERGPSASRPRLRERRGRPRGEGSHGNVAERDAQTLL